MHGKQRRHSLQRGAVADACRNCDDRCRREPSDKARQSPLHPGHDDDGVGAGDVLYRREEPVNTCHPAIAEERGTEAERTKDRRALLGYRQVSRSGRAYEHASGSFRPLPPDDRAEASRLWLEGCPEPAGGGLQRGCDLLPIGPGQDDRPAVPGGEHLGDDSRALRGSLARPVDGFGQPLAQSPVVIDLGETELRER